jgi:chromosome segregation ATPase
MKTVLENEKEQWMQKEREILEDRSIMARDLEELKQANQSELERLKEELQTAQEITTVLESEKEQWMQKERDILNEKSAVAQELDKYKQASELSKIEIQRLNEEVETAQETKAELNDKLSKLSKYLEEKREEYIRRLQDKDRRCLALNEDVKELRKEIEDLKNKVKGLEEERQMSKNRTLTQVLVLYFMFVR